MSCITARFNGGALHIFNVGMIVLRNSKRRFRLVVVESLGFGVGAFRSEGGKDLRIVEDDSGMKDLRDES